MTSGTLHRSNRADQSWRDASSSTCRWTAELYPSTVRRLLSVVGSARALAGQQHRATTRAAGRHTIWQRRCQAGQWCTRMKIDANTSRSTASKPTNSPGLSPCGGRPTPARPRSPDWSNRAEPAVTGEVSIGEIERATRPGDDEPRAMDRPAGQVVGSGSTPASDRPAFNRARRASAPAAPRQRDRGRRADQRYQRAHPPLGEPAGQAVSACAGEDDEIRKATGAL
jgi:hypothetical protein